MTRRAVILVSGGLDSATCLAIAKDEGFDCYALSINYRQRHQCELIAAANIVAHADVVEHKVLQLDLAGISGSALTDSSVPVPQQPSEGIPVTYVPARNTIFLSLALGWAEVIDAHDIFIGVNAVDYSGYPDCRPAFINAFEKTANLATKLGIEGRGFQLNTPLINLRKLKSLKLGSHYRLTMGLQFLVTIQPKMGARAENVIPVDYVQLDFLMQVLKTQRFI